MAAEFADFEVEIDLTDVPEMDGSFQLIPPGDYTFDVIKVEQKPSSKNNPMIVVTFQVPEDSDSPHAGSRAWGNYSLLKQSWGRLKTLMVACGASLDKFRASEIMGARLRATIVHRQGDARVDPATGQMQEAKTFANVVSERPLEDAPAAAAPAATPPVANKGKAAAPAAKPANSTAGAARRA